MAKEKEVQEKPIVISEEIDSIIENTVELRKITSNLNRCKEPAGKQSFTKAAIIRVENVLKASTNVIEELQSTVEEKKGKTKNEKTDQD